MMKPNDLMSDFVKGHASRPCDKAGMHLLSLCIDVNPRDLVLAVRLKTQETAGDGKRPQETAKTTGILKFTENYVLKVKC